MIIEFTDEQLQELAGGKIVRLAANEEHHALVAMDEQTYAESERIRKGEAELDELIAFARKHNIRYGWDESP